MLDDLAGEVGMGRDASRARLGPLIAGFLGLGPAHGPTRPATWIGASSASSTSSIRRSRLPELVHGSLHIEITKLNEQVGVALLQRCEAVRRGSVRPHGWGAHYRGPSGAIDFAGRCPDTPSRMTPIDGKYVPDSWRRQALGIRHSALGRGILARRDVLDATRGALVEGETGAARGSGASARAPGRRPRRIS